MAEKQVIDLGQPDLGQVGTITSRSIAVLEDLAGRRRSLDEGVKALEAEKDRLTQEMTDIIAAWENVFPDTAFKLPGDGAPVIQIVRRAGNTKISREKLLIHGVDPEIIAAATEIGKASQSLRVDWPKGR